MLPLMGHCRAGRPPPPHPRRPGPINPTGQGQDMLPRQVGRLSFPHPAPPPPPPTHTHPTPTQPSAVGTAIYTIITQTAALQTILIIPSSLRHPPPPRAGRLRVVTNLAGRRARIACTSTTSHCGWIPGATSAGVTVDRGRRTGGRDTREKDRRAGWG